LSDQPAIRTVQTAFKLGVHFAKPVIDVMLLTPGVTVVQVGGDRLHDIRSTKSISVAAMGIKWPVHMFTYSSRQPLFALNVLASEINPLPIDGEFACEGLKECAEFSTAECIILHHQ
jgi:hypothetical protein